MESVTPASGDPKEKLQGAICQDNAAAVRELLERHPELQRTLHEPSWGFDAPAVAVVRSRAMLDVLLDAGADINAKSRWWAGGFGLLHGADPGLAAYAIERGAVVDVHAAARLGRIGRLRELILADPSQVHARGGDGQTPLHFASTVEVAAFLLEHGADIDALDVDHESSPAQYMTGDRREIARYLVQRGCKSDLLMAAALGDVALARKHLDANPDCIRLRVSNQYFPMISPKAGGTIYQWTLGWYVSAHEVARQLGHDDLLRLLWERSPAEVRLLAACWTGTDDAAVQSLLSDHPGLATRLSEPDRRQMAHAARNNQLGAVRLMLAAGLPVTATGQHGGSPLHWAAWHGNVEMVDAILPFHPPLETVDHDFKATPMHWAVHGSQHGWDCKSGNYPATVEKLIQAGAKLPPNAGGTEAVKRVLRRHGVPAE